MGISESTFERLRSRSSSNHSTSSSHQRNSQTSTTTSSVLGGQNETSNQLVTTQQSRPENSNRVTNSRFQPMYIISYSRTSRSNGTSPQDSEGRQRRFMLVVIGSRLGGGNAPFSNSESFNDILNRIFELHEPKGPPPASESAINSLPTIALDEKIKTEHERCSVCYEEFQLGNVGILLPCKHVFDKDCILSWLKQHNTCPICRYELPVEDAEYEKGRVERMSARQTIIEQQQQQQEETTEKTEQESKETIPLNFENENNESDTKSPPHQTSSSTEKTKRGQKRSRHPENSSRKRRKK